MLIDIYQKIEHDFGADASMVHAELSLLDAHTKGLIPNRLIRAIIYLSKGDLSEFRLYVEKARLDWKNVLWQAECDPPDTEIIRDFTKSFYELKLYKRKT
ncbi:MAG: hypothetical protein RL693_275 [Verrucomicrobiota bacterium]|jgi:hypothetical protein